MSLKHQGQEFMGESMTQKRSAMRLLQPPITKLSNLKTLSSSEAATTELVNNTMEEKKTA